MDKDLRVFRELLLWIWRSHDKPWEYKNPQALEIANKYLNLRGTFQRDEELEAHLPSEDIVQTGFGPNRFLYMNPVTDARVMVPVIQLKCDFGCNCPEVRCRLFLFLLHNGGLKSVGFRFESPEGKALSGQGVHHYYHAQIIQAPRIPQTRTDWLPEVQPAFPLDANDPVKLILCILIGLYGLEYLGMVRNVANIWKLDEYIDSMFCRDFDPIERFWIVNFGDPVKHTKYYQTHESREDFSDFITSRYPGCTIRGMTSSKYQSLPPRERLVYRK